MAEMVRIIVHDHTDAFLCDLEPENVVELSSIEEVNGEHSLTIVTTQELEKTNRLIVRDGMGHWHEYVVLGIMSEHSEGGEVFHEYYCIWSLQYDLSATFIDDQFGCGVVPGHPSVPQTALKGMQCALEGTTRWAIGTVSVTNQASASFYRRSGWEGLQTVVEKWGGEIHATIHVSTTGVVAREVDLLAHEGSATPARRFDYGWDVTGIRRTISDEIWPCRIVPLGASQETEAGGYTRRPSIESVNGGVMWLQDDAMVPYTRVPDGNGGWEYPTLIVKNDTYEEPADLLAWATGAISDYTKPIVSYEAQVAQFVKAGMDAHGVALGDEVVVVDRTFGSEGLEISSRVVKIEQNLLDPSDTKLTIGNVTETLGDQLEAIAVGVEDVADSVASAWQYQGSSAEWVSNLLDRINTEANTTGGYFYYTEGQGVRTYDVAVSDPLVGAEASQVCEIKGGTMRIANTKDGQGNWEWKTVFTSGRILAELIDAIGASSGYHAQLTPTGLDVYDGANIVAHFGAEAEFYDGAGHKLVTIGAYSTAYREGKIDFGSAIGYLTGRYDTTYGDNTLLLKGQSYANIRSPYVMIEASGSNVSDEDWGTSTRDATVELRADRSWSSDPNKSDYAGMKADVNSGGTPPSVQIVVQSGDALGGLIDLSSSSSHDVLEVWCDRIQLMDSRTGTMGNYINIFPTHGTVGQTTSIAANSYHDFNVSFGHTYASAPNVQLTIYTTSTATTFDCDIYLRSVSTTGFTARIVNREGTARSPGFHWKAIG